MTSNTKKVFGYFLILAIVLIILVSRLETPAWMKASDSEVNERGLDEMRNLFEEFYNKSITESQDWQSDVTVHTSATIKSGLEPAIKSGIEPAIKSGIEPVIKSGIEPAGAFHVIGKLDTYGYTKKLYVYSAFYERADPRSEVKAGIKAVGLVPMKLRHVNFTQVFCHVTYEGQTGTQTISGKIWISGKHIHLTSRIKFGPALTLCPLPEDRPPPRTVSFSLASNGTKSYSFDVINPVVTKKWKFTVCYSVLFKDYDDYSQLMQNVEYNREMGAQHFYIYVQSAGPRVTALLDFYQKQGLFTVLAMPADPSRKAWYNSQAMALNDCHCRARYTSDYIVVVDPDEFIFPLKHNNWHELVKMLESQKGEAKSEGIEGKSKPDLSLPVAHFSFIHTYYCFKEMNPPEKRKLRRNLSLTAEDENFIRELYVYLFIEMIRSDFFTYPARVKTIYRPELVLEAGTHYPQKIAPGTRDMAVNTELAFLHHHNHKARLDEKTCRLEFHAQPFFKPYLHRLQSVYLGFSKDLANLS